MFIKYLHYLLLLITPTPTSPTPTSPTPTPSPLTSMIYETGILTEETDPYISKFINYIKDYNKVYSSVDEINHVFNNFVNNVKLIENHDEYKHGYSIGINQFTDMSKSEFNSFVKDTCIISKVNSNKCLTFNSKKSNEELPDKIDWREHNVVTPVKNQGMCGSCWSFSATGAMEGAWAIKNKNLISFSEQQLVDCSGSYGDDGCDGGLMDYAFLYAIDNGICSEDDIPYKGNEGNCKSCENPISMVSCVDVTPKNQIHLKEAVSYGPVSVSIEADTSIFQSYKNGIISSVGCGTNLNHGVLIVGYGAETDGTMYWIVKNSWGPEWGDSGYVKIARSEDISDPGICGISLQASYPVC